MLLLTVPVNVTVSAVVSPNCTSPLNVPEPVTTKSPLTVRSSISNVVATRVCAYKFLHSFPAVGNALGSLPKSQVLSSSGIIWLLISALNTMLSVFALPIVMSPSAVIFPVACKLPLISTSVLFDTVPITTLPLPVVLNCKSWSAVVTSIVFVLICKSPVTILP